MKIGKKRAVTVALVLMALLAKPQITFAQVTPTPIRGSWEGLKAVPAGDEVSVRLRNGQKLKGRLISVSDTALTLAHGNITTDVTRGDALRVHRVISKSAKRATLIGLGIGAGCRFRRIIMKTRKKGAIVVAFALMAMLAKPQFAFAQVTPAPIIGSWEVLKAIPPGDEVRVRLRNGQTLKGRLISVSDTALTLARGDITTDVTRGDALRVHRVISKSAKRATLIGLAW